MTLLTIAGGELVLGDSGCRNVVVRDGRIVTVDAKTTEGTVVDATGLLVAPGFIDLQCNGADDIDLTTEPERVWELAARLPRHGVTSFLPTLVSCPSDVVDRALAAIARRPAGFRGAEPLGLHLEGPMLNPARRGAHRGDMLRAPDDDWYCRPGVSMVTLAPELPGALDLIRALRDAGIVAAAGHTDATADELTAAINAGLTGVTHLFNAMRPFGHRDVGPVGVALTDDRVIAGVIADGVHVDPRAVTIAWRSLGADRLALVTDRVAKTLAGDPVSHTGQAVREPDGRLAGSRLTMDQAVRNLMAFTGCTLAEAVAAATATPARLLAVRRGRCSPGAPADLVLLTREAEVVAVVAGGSIVFEEPAWRS
jgi:N-acetylglucosamine-6-phosphate deacetylase